MEVIDFINTILCEYPKYSLSRIESDGKTINIRLRHRNGGLLSLTYDYDL